MSLERCRFGIVLLGLALGSQACEGEGDSMAPVGGGVSEEAPVKILPKWKLPGDYRIPGKADAFDDYRKAHPEWYALTVAPDKAGFRTATEWQEMQGVLLGFPGSQGTSVNNSIVQMVVQGVDYVDWYIVVPSASVQTNFVNLLKSNGLSQAKIDEKVHFLQFNLDSIWMIDYGPFTLVGPDASVAFADFRYYHERIHDDAIPTKVGNALGVTTYRAGLDFEGGNFQMDEVGTCYHSQGLFWENPDKTEAEIHDILSRYLGCKTFVVLAPLQDGTTHIDMFSKLVSKNQIVLGKANTTTATQTTVNTLEQDFGILQAAVLADGSKLTIYRIPMPYQKDGVWRTYTNSTLANGVNLWPVYSINKDLEAQALAVWQSVMPSWNHVGINSDTIITWGGAMHCISRALPAGTYQKWVADGVCSGGTCQAPAGGYDGSCTSNANCVGPKWLCPLPECGSTPQGCGNVTWEGCCDGETLKYCEDNQLQTMNCAQDPYCGWNAGQGFYDCGTNGGADPSGQHPKACAACTPDCTNKVCGDDGCGGSCGTCRAGQVCQAGQCVACTPNCTGKVCGDDGCGGSCGTCPAGQTCQAGQCVQNQEYPNQCLGPNQPSASSCTAVQTFEGCCDAKGRVIWCEDGKLYCIDCAKLSPQCGWDPQGFYNCGTNGGADPSGQNPKACVACTPNCTGKVCGDDGCGGSCGTCPPGQACQAGQCVACTPNCAGKQCGDDGCGGSCGACPAGYTCQKDQCVKLTDPCNGITIEGCCDGNVNWWCEDNQLFSEDCSKTNPPSQCGWLVPGGQYVSGYYCGGSGADPSGKFPLACPKPCTPNCTGKVCGDDGCGGSCGTCGDQEQCQEGQCVSVVADSGPDTGAPDTGLPDTSQSDAVCVPDCEGKQCGPDGCGQTCGTCPSGSTCDSQGQCVAQADTSVPDIGIPDTGSSGTDSGNGDIPSTDSGSGTSSKGGGCTTSQGGSSWSIALLLMIFGLVALLRRARPE